MRNFLFICVATILISEMAHAGKKFELDAQLVLKGSTDTVYKKLSVRSQTLDPDQVSFASVIESPLKFVRNGIVEKIKIEDIEYLEFTDIQGVKRIFVQEDKVGLTDKRRKLIEIVHNGTILFCRRYRQNLNAGSGQTLPLLMTRSYKPAVFGGSTYAYKPIDYFIYEGYDPVQLNLYFKKDRKSFVEMIPDRADLHKRINDIKSYEELVQILKDYDTDPKIIAARQQQNSSETRSNTLKILNTIDSVNTRKIESSNDLNVGDFIKYVGPGNEKIGVVKKIVSARAIIMTYDLENDPKEFMVRISDVELIIE